MSEKHPINYCNIYEVLWLTEAPLVSGLKQWRLPKQEKQSSGRPVAAVSPEMLQCADSFVRKEGHITNRQLASCLLISKRGILHSIHDLGYRKVCSKLVPRGHTVEQETERKAISFD